jgi:hypothetical protein
VVAVVVAVVFDLKIDLKYKQQGVMK